jgi:transposase
MGLKHRKGRTIQEKKFDQEEDLVKYGLDVLVDAGLSIEQVDRLRNRRELGVLYDNEMVGLRRYATSELLAAGLSNAQIAKVFKQSKETVNADRQHIRQVYVDRIMATADQWRAKLLDEQELLKAKALESFEQSKRRTVKRIQERQGAETVTMEEYNSAGESSFLSVAKGCLEQQAKLLGLFDNRPQAENDDKSYKKFLSNLSAQVKKINEAEQNATDRAVAIDAEAEFDDQGEPVGRSRPMLPADDQES